jgi:hypothetical protein
MCVLFILLARRVAGQLHAQFFADTGTCHLTIE